MADGGISPGEVGGVFAGLVALLAALGKGFAWLINWRDARVESRGRRLKAWEESLDRREQRHRAETEQRLEAMETKVDVLSSALFEALGELQRLDPASPVLAKARLVLKRAFPEEPEVPASISALVRRLDNRGNDA